MTFEKLLEQMEISPAKDPSDDLRALRDGFLKRTGRFNEPDLKRFSALAISLLQQVPMIERMAFARLIAKHRATPHDLLMLLTNDHYMVSAPVLESAPMLTEEDLKETIARFGSAVFLAIAKRDELSMELTDRLMSDAEQKVQQALAGNTGARLSRRSMTSLCELAESDTALRDALGKRRDLPQALSSRLRALAAPGSVKQTPKDVPRQDTGTGVGRAGIVLSANNPDAKPAAKVKTIRYS